MVFERGRQRGEQRVMIVDASRQFVEYVSPAVARRLLKDQRVTMLRKSPCTLQLPPSGVRPTAFGHAEEESKMAIRSSNMINFTEFFREEKEVWVLNIGGGQVSLEFDTGHGNKVGKCITMTGAPENISDEVPWDAIKNSADFRKLLKRRPKVLELMTTEEAFAHMAKTARRKSYMVRNPETGELEPDVGRVAEEAEVRRRGMLEAPIQASARTVDAIHEGNQGMFGKPRSARELDMMERGEAGGPGEHSNLGKEGEVKLNEVVNGRILHLCQQVSMELPPEERMQARELLNELEILRPSLHLEDANHIMSFGTWPTVKKWGRQLASELALAASEAEENEAAREAL